MQKKKDTKSNRIRQKNKRVDSKVESNDRPEIADGGGGERERDMRHPRPPFGWSEMELGNAVMTESQKRIESDEN